MINPDFYLLPKSALYGQSREWLIGDTMSEVARHMGWLCLFQELYKGLGMRRQLCLNEKQVVMIMLLRSKEIVQFLGFRPDRIVVHIVAIRPLPTTDVLQSLLDDNQLDSESSFVI